jgi:L-alanine-DL-glutamate epimerase-like enolase superfamily enzyme
MTRRLKVAQQSWPITGGFRISRGAKTAADVVVVELSDGTATGRGECVPYARYGETVDGVAAAINAHGEALCEGLSRGELQTLMPPGAARNAVDCALWDLDAKLSGKRAWQLAGFGMARLTTAYTLSLDTADNMALAAANAAHRPLLKVKLGQNGDAERLRAIRAAAPDTRLIVDANEGWSPADIVAMFAVCAETGVELVEQPLPADDDALLAQIPRPIPVCADESAHGLASLDAITGRYDAVNIKLDKTGGLTEALALAAAAQDRGLTIMVGCMLGTSLAMAPAMVAAQQATVVDLDGPLLLTEDRVPGIEFDGSTMLEPPAALWG